MVFLRRDGKMAGGGGRGSVRAALRGALGETCGGRRQQSQGEGSVKSAARSYYASRPLKDTSVLLTECTCTYQINVLSARF